MPRTETVTVVVTDLVGSTELASRLGHDAYEALRQQHFAALRAAVTKHGGTEVKTETNWIRAMRRVRCQLPGSGGR
jgi:class 3 adenylate cyclase